MNFRTLIYACTLFTALSIIPLQAEQSPEDATTNEMNKVFASQGDVSITYGEIDAAISKVPAEFRMPFIRNGERMDRVVGDMLRVRIVAEDAKAVQFDEGPLIKSRMAIAAERELAEAWMTKIKADTPQADYEAMAHEYYLANPEQFMTEEVVDVSHILIGNEDRSDEDALELATSLREQLFEDPSRFDAMIIEYSDDPSKGSNNGRFPNTKRGQMARSFEDMSFSMENPGDISELVETGYGYHIIRLNKKFPPRPISFKQIKAGAIKEARENHLEEHRAQYISKLVDHPIDLEDGAVEAMLKRHFGENLELAPVYQE